MGEVSHSVDSLHDVNYRERTFTSRPQGCSQIPSRDLANAGFIHKCQSDVKCFKCGFELNCSLFRELSEILRFHSEMRPDCELSVSLPHYPEESHSSPLHEEYTPYRGEALLQSSRHIQDRTFRGVECKGFNSYDSLRYERERLSTYIDWPITWLSPESLAKEGFYYLRDKDFVSCVFCRGIVGAWEPGDVPSKEHKRHFSTCPFVRKQPVGNIPIEQGDLIASLPTSEIILPVNKEMTSPSKSNSVASLQSTFLSSEKEFAELLPGYSGPKRKEYLTKESRLKSYKDWPTKVKISPARLAEAGLFYCGLSDHVRCFHCGNGLRNWEADDDPWVEHARWYPTCHFVQLQKGEEYISKVFQEKPPFYRSSRHDPNSLEVSSSPPDTLPRVVSPSGAPFYSQNSRVSYKVHITEKQLNVLMDLDIQQAAIAMGFQTRVVRAALREKIETTGVPFFSLESCVEQLLKWNERLRLENEAEDKQSARLQEFRVEKIRRNHEESLRRAEVSGDGEDVATHLQLATSARSEQRLVTTPPSPIITSPVLPPRRPRVAEHESGSGSTAVSSNLNLDRNISVGPVNINESLRRSRAVAGPDIPTGITTNQSPDIVEYPIRRSYGDEPMDTSGSGISEDRDTTPTNEEFNATSTPEPSPTQEGQSLVRTSTEESTSGGDLSRAPTLIIESSNSRSSSSSNNAPVSPTTKSSSADSFCRKKVLRLLSSSSNKSETSEPGCVSRCLSSSSSGTASDDSESGLDDSASSVSEGDCEISLEAKLAAAQNEVQALSQQLERLRESRLCKICMDADLSVVVLPCTHMATCVNCVLALSTCPICRTEIKHVIKPNIVW